MIKKPTISINAKTSLTAHGTVGGSLPPCPGLGVGVGRPFLRADHERDGADPEEDEDEIQDDAGKGVGTAVVLREGVGAEVGTDAMGW